MAKVFAELMPVHQKFIQKQQLFFVTTAPLRLDIHRVQMSCVYGVPFYGYPGQRPTFPLGSK